MSLSTGAPGQNKRVSGVKELIEAFGATVQYLPQAADRF